MPRKVVSDFKELAKSGIVSLVLISVLGGYLVGQPMESPIDWGRFLLTFFGVLFLASGSSALNQIQERDVDALMPRTAQRPLPSGRIGISTALAFVAASLALGIGMLSLISREMLFLGLAAFFSYNVLYTLWWKRRWAYAAVPGAIPGALPILMGHTAASGDVWHPAGLYLFAILFYWQMPHFWVLALRYREDYEKGNFPTLPVARGEAITRLQITIWCLAYAGIALVAPFFTGAKSVYLLIAIPVCLKVLLELKRFVSPSPRDKTPEGKRWLRFFLWVNFSLIFFIGAAVLDRWSFHLLTPYFTR